MAALRGSFGPPAAASALGPSGSPGWLGVAAATRLSASQTGSQARGERWTNSGDIHHIHVVHAVRIHGRCHAHPRSSATSRFSTL